MNGNINLGKIDENGFKESKSAAIARLFLEQNNKIKTHFMEMDKTPNFDGKLMILEGSFERITVEVQIKTLPKSVKRDAKGNFLFICDTKAFNAVMEKVTFNPVVLLVVDINNYCVYCKLLTREYVCELQIGEQKSKTIWLSEADKFQDDIFIKQVYREAKITNTDTDCITNCGMICESIRNAEKATKENYEKVYERGEIKGYFTTYKYIDGSNQKSFLLSKIKMQYGKHVERLHFQYDKDYIHINRVETDLLDITDADIANIVLEVAKEIRKPILYTYSGKPIYWFQNGFLWQLRAEEIHLDWFLRY